MNNLAIWSETKYELLKQKLNGKWEKNHWILKKDNGEKWSIYFTCNSVFINVELKYACSVNYKNKNWGTNNKTRSQFIHKIIRFLNKYAKNETTLMAKPLEKWINLLIYYLKNEDTWIGREKVILTASQEMKTYKVNDRSISVFRVIYKTLKELYDQRSEYEKDVWDLRVLGVESNAVKNRYKLNFKKIKQKWLRDTAKKYSKYNLTINSASNTIIKITALNHLSNFLTKRNNNLKDGSGLNRKTILAFIESIVGLSLADSSKNNYVKCIKNFLEVCGRESWGKIANKEFIRAEDIPQAAVKQPRFIPENVLVQLNRNIEYLSPYIMRMVLVIQECGMRISDLCHIPFNCIDQDVNGSWTLSYIQNKTKNENKIPISNKVVNVIQEQQLETIKIKDEKAKYLFYDEEGKIITVQRFSYKLNKLAYSKNICDKNGKIYRFKSHQFRHTVGTRMINQGVPQHIVQRYLGHETASSTKVYAHIFNKTMKKEYAKYKGKIVDVNGEFSSPDSLDMQWLKDNIFIQTLANGFCNLPVYLNECPHANSCLTCANFRTTKSFLNQHIKQLNYTKEIIKEAEEAGWTRVEEMNKQIKNNLEKIILSLKEETDDS
jgi:site-specific recombinase XerD